MGVTMKEVVEQIGWLGIIREVHSIGPYDLAEYEQREINNSKTNGKTFYLVFVDGENTSNSFLDIDEALIFAISKRNLREPDTARWYARVATKILMFPEPPHAQ